MGKTISSYSESYYTFSIELQSAYFTAFGQSFVGTGVPLDLCIFYLKKGGSPTGNAVAKLYAHTGTFGTSSKPTGAALATSNNVDVSKLTTSYQLIPFVFSTPYTPADGTYYVVTVEYSGGDASNYLNVGVDNTSPDHAGNSSYYYTSTWNIYTGWDAVFYACYTGIRAVGTPATGNGATITPTIPAGAVVGDKLLVISGTRTNSQTCTISAGWDELYDPGSQSTGSLFVYSRTYQASDSNPTLTPIVPPSTSNADSVIAVIIAMADWNTTTLLDVSISAAAFSAPGDNNVTIPGITTATDGALAFFVAVSTDDNTYVYQSGGGISLVSQNETAGSDAALWIGCKYMPSAGGTGDQVTQQTTKGGDAGRYLTFAIKPAVSGTAYTQSVDGSLTSSASLVGKGLKALTGTMTPAGTITRAITYPSLAGALASTGIITKISKTSMAGAISFEGALSATRVILLVLTAALAFVGDIVKRTSKTFSAEFSSSGTIRKEIDLERIFSGVLTTSGTILKSTKRTLDGALASTGTLAGKVLKALAGALTSSGLLIRKTLFNLAGAMASAGTLTRKVFTILAGVLLSSAELAAQKVSGLIRQAIDGGMAFAGEITKVTGKSLTAGLTQAGEIVKRIAANLAGAFNSSGELSTKSVVLLALSGAVSFTGEVSRKTLKSLVGVLITVGNLIGSKLGGAVDYVIKFRRRMRR